MDHDIKASIADEKLAEHNLDHKWIFGTVDSKEKWVPAKHMK